MAKPNSFLDAVKQKLTPQFVGTPNAPTWQDQVPTANSAYQQLQLKAGLTSPAARLPIAQLMATGGTKQVEDIASDYWFGPIQPTQPVGPASYRPRQYAYTPGANLIWTPGEDKGGVTFEMLRALADSWDLLRLVIETRKDQLERMKWQIRVTSKPGENIDAKNARQQNDPIVRLLTEFFNKPDGFHSWHQWVRMWMEDVFVLDAGALYYERDLTGRISSLMPLDGGSINRLLTDQGTSPSFPSAAYQQVVYGIPAADLTVRDMLYVMRNERTWRRYGFCYSDDSEILTKDGGWKNFKDLLWSDLVATRNNQTKELEWQLPSKIYHYDYEGDMCHFYSKSMDLLVTPEHRMLVASRNGDGWTEKIWPASYYAERCELGDTGIPVSCGWHGREIVEKVFPGVKHTYEAGNQWGARWQQTVTSPAVKLSGDDYCALMGMYLAEGYSHSEGGISICQQQESKGFLPFKQVLQRINKGKEVYHDGGEFVYSYQSIGRFCSQFGLAHGKYIPADIKNASPRQLRIFWEYYTLGDGCYQTQDNVSGRGTHPTRRDSFTTVSKRLADDLTEVAHKLGWSVYIQESDPYVEHFEFDAVSTKGKTTHYVYDSKCRRSYCGNVRYSSVLSVHSKRVDYKGKVHCVTVPNGIVLTRRNGRPAWCGNSPVEQILITISIGLRRQDFVLQYYTSGNMPEGLCFLPPNITVPRIKEIQDWFDSVLSGNLAKRRRLTFLPGYGTGSGNSEARPNVVFPKEPLLTDPLDDWLMKIVCFAFSVSPQNLQKQMNRASAQQSSEVSQEEGLEPSMALIEDVCNQVIQEMGLHGEYEFGWLEERETDPLKQAQIDNLLLGKVYSINETRGARGLAPRPEPQADMLGVFSPMGFVPIDTPPPQPSQGGSQQSSMQDGGLARLLGSGNYIHSVYGDLSLQDSFFAYDPDSGAVIVKGMSESEIQVAKKQLLLEGTVLK